MHRSAQMCRVWDSGVACQLLFARLDNLHCLANLLMKSPSADEPGCILLCEINHWSCFQVDVNWRSPYLPKGIGVRIAFSTSYAFHATRCVPAFPHQVKYEVLQCLVSFYRCHLLVTHRVVVQILPNIVTADFNAPIYIYRS